MAQSEDDDSFFLELEKAAKGLSVASSVHASDELRRLYEEFRDEAANGASPPDECSMSLSQLRTDVAQTPSSNSTKTPFEPVGLQARMLPGLLLISKISRALWGLKLSKAGFHNGQDELILVLEENNPVSVSFIADELRIRPSTVSKMLDRLEEKKLAKRMKHKADARKSVVSIMPLELEAQRKLYILRDELEIELSKMLGDLEHRRLSSELLHLDGQLSRHLLRQRY